ncbi:ectoine/hydroxyectoine ABC transporter permease subunit EhuC [Gordonia sp. GN26]
MNLDQLELLARGTMVTVTVTLGACVLAGAVALIAGLGRTSGIRVVRTAATIFIEVFRGTSALVQLYVAFFVLPLFGLEMSPMVAGILALGLNGGSYGAEIVRSGLAAVPAGQREAATALDMPRLQQLRHVILPHAMVIILRPAGNLMIDLLKASSLVSLITLADLTFQGEMIRSATGETAKVLVALLVIYFVLSSVIAWGINLAERRVRRGLDVVVRSTDSDTAKVGV